MFCGFVDERTGLDVEALELRRLCSKVGVNEGERPSSSVEHDSRRLVNLPGARRFSSTAVLSLGRMPSSWRRLFLAIVGEELLASLTESGTLLANTEAGVAGVVLADNDGVELRTLSVEVESSGAGGWGLDGAAGAFSMGASKCRLLNAGGDDARCEAWCALSSGSRGDESSRAPESSTPGIEDASSGKPR